LEANNKCVAKALNCQFVKYYLIWSTFGKIIADIKGFTFLWLTVYTHWNSKWDNHEQKDTYS